MNPRANINNQPKKVRFLEDSVTYDSLENYLLQDEIEAMWLTTEELKGIFLRCRAVMLGGSKEQPDDEEEPIRGLEPINPETRAARAAAIHEFMVEQEVQRFVGGERRDDEALANILKKHSTHRQRLAHARGIQDAQAVLGVPSVSRASLSPGDHHSENNRNLRRAERRTQAARMA